jgi:hypothetical protein
LISFLLVVAVQDLPELVLIRELGFFVGRSLRGYRVDGRNQYEANSKLEPKPLATP